MKRFLIKLFNILPEGSFKNKMRCCGFNFYRQASGGIEASFNKGYFQFTFQNGISVKSYYDIGCDLVDSLPGYLKNYQLQKGDIVVDAGAYVGDFALYAAQIIGKDGQIFAFEPDPENYKRLLNNIKLNGLNNIIPINKGLWSKNMMLPLEINLISSTFFFSPDKKNSHTLVPVSSLDDELEERGIRKVDFIKMDVEGAEIEAVKGSEKTLKNNDVKLAIASYHLINGQKTCFELEKLLQRFGYKTETSFPLHLTTWAAKNI